MEDYREVNVQQLIAQMVLGALVLVLFITPALAQYPSEVFEVYVGQTEILTAKDVTRISLGSGNYADVKVLSDAGQVLILAKKTGTTDLRLWFRNGKQSHYLLRILDQPPELVLQQVQQHLADIEGISIRQLGDRIVINGSSLRESDMQRVEAVTKQFSNVVSYVTAGGITMHGMIYMDVKVVEVKKRELLKVGVDWDNVIAGPQYANLSDFKSNNFYRPNAAPGDPLSILPNNVGRNNAYFGISTSITSVINLLSQNGDAKMLAEPKLTCRSGGKAEFLAGGEVPLPVRNQDGSVSVTFKQYGIILKMTPISDPEGYISTHVSVEISTIDDSVTVLDIPGFLTRKTETDMNLKQGQTMVISGLLSNESSKDVDKLPGLGNIPVLGELFKSRNFQNKDTELVILVTPSIIDPDHKINKAWVRRSEEMQSEGAERIKFNLLD